MPKIPELIAIKEASFDVAQTLQTIDVARTLERPIGVLTGSDTFIFEAMVMGCDGALIGFAGTATGSSRRHERRACSAATSGEAKIDLGTARAASRATAGVPPIRDFRPRMKEVLRLQGHFPSAACREPQLGVSDD